MKIGAFCYDLPPMKIPPPPPRKASTVSDEMESTIKRLCKMDATVRFCPPTEEINCYRIRIVSGRQGDRIASGITKFLPIEQQEASLAPTLASMVDDLEKLNELETET